jgi:tetratricopeptide (TPR) repeat protein
MVAIKVLHQHLSLNTQTLKRFEQEAQTASTLAHPNIVGIIDYGTSPQPYIVMEYLEGRSLQEVLESSNGLPVSRSIAIGQAVCSALQAAHSRGVVHRDIKPSNIAIIGDPDNTASVKVLDFGISKLLDADGNSGGGISRTGDTIGSPPYMSPEQWTGKEVDTRTDIYALGCLLYEVLTGKTAFSADTVMELMEKHFTELPEGIVAVRPDLPDVEALDSIVFKAISKSPAERYGSVEELAADLDLVKNGQPPRYARRRRHTLTELLKWRRAILTKGLAAITLLVTVALVVAFFNRIALLDTVWRFNFESGKNALATKDYKTAELKLTTALRLIELTGSKDKRLYWTLKRLQPVLKAEKKWPELTRVNGKIALLTTGGERCKSMLGSANYAYGRGDFASGVQFSLNALNEAKKVSPENLALATALNDLGVNQAGLKQCEKAEKSISESLRIREDWLEKDDSLIIDTHLNLGQAYLCQQKYPQAKRELEEALASQEKLLGPQSAGVATTLNELGSLCFETKNYAAAERYLERCIPIWEKTVDFENAPLSNALNNLGEVYMAERRYAKAEKQFQRCLSLTEKWYGPDHPNVAALLENMAQLRYYENNIDDALALLKKSWMIRASKLGPNAPRTLQTRSAYENLLRTAQASGKKARQD